MKRILVILMAITLLMVLSSCDGIENDYGIRENDCGFSEWTSPDGVHYWIFKDYHRFGLTPRYDSDGKLVIEGR